MHFLLPCWYGHGISIKTVDIILLPPVLYCIHTKCLGKHELIKNTFNKGIRISLLKHIIIMNVSNNFFHAHSWHSRFFFIFNICTKASITTTEQKLQKQNAWLLVWLIFAMWHFLLLSFSPMQRIPENYALNFWVIIWQHVGNSYLDLLLNTNYEIHFSFACILKATDSERSPLFF